MVRKLIRAISLAPLTNKFCITNLSFSINHNKPGVLSSPLLLSPNSQERKHQYTSRSCIALKRMAELGKLRPVKSVKYHQSAAHQKHRREIAHAEETLESFRVKERVQL